MNEVHLQQAASRDWILHRVDDPAVPTAPTDSKILYRSASFDVAPWLSESSTIVRRYKPERYLTVLSQQQLGRHGLRTVAHEAANWLVPIDASDLDVQHPSAVWIEELRKRIAELRQLAEEEGLRFRSISADDALEFAEIVNASARPSAFLVGNGNVRLVWENDKHEQVGLQFVGDGRVQYILFACREGGLSENIGIDDKDTVMRFVTAAGLRHLLAA